MLLMLSVMVSVVVADQASKAAVVARLPEGTFTSKDIFGIRLRHVANRAKPWGSTSAVRLMTIAWLLLTGAALVAAALIDSELANAALGATIGGATGNLLDGVNRRAVTDFIDLRVWPVFNVADAAIVAGATILLWTVVRFPTG